jgi:hypothetical protein
LKSWTRIIATFTILALCVPLIGTTGAQAASAHDRVVELRDNCEPTSWNAEFGPGFCAKADGTVTVAKFRAALKDGGSGAWWIRQREITLDKGDTIAATNVGGIIHTYTEVAQFGKGCIPEWNTAVKETVDNCNGFRDFGATLVFPGGTSTPQTLSVGVHKFQCLVHPWMREVVTVRT